MSPVNMKPEEMRQARESLGLTQAQFAALMHVEGKDRTVRKWENGERPIPGPVGVLVRLLVDLQGTRDYAGKS